jgi:spore coat polysaccharide biosynthesis predicted glycosyltransferase SpsG
MANRKDIKHPIQAPRSCQCRYLGPEYAEIRARFHKVSDARILLRWRALRVRLIKLGVPDRCRNIYRLDNPFASNLAIATLISMALAARGSRSRDQIEILTKRNAARLIKAPAKEQAA